MITVGVFIPSDNEGASRYLLSRSRDRGWWFPSESVDSEQTIKSTAQRIASMVAGTVVNLNCILKTRFVHAVRDVNTAILVVFLAHPVRSILCPQTDDRKWFTVDEMQRLLLADDGLLGNEPLELAKLLSKKGIPSPPDFEEVLPEWIDVSGDVSQKPNNEQLVEASQLRQHEQRLLYKEFIDYSQPSSVMTFQTFKKVMVKKGLQPDLVADTFRAFDVNQKNVLTFGEYLLGLAAMEPCTKHGGAPAQLRCQYIFRYYDSNGDNQLQVNEFSSVPDYTHMLKQNNLTFRIIVKQH